MHMSKKYIRVHLTIVIIKSLLPGKLADSFATTDGPENLGRHVSDVERLPEPTRTCNNCACRLVKGKQVDPDLKQRVEKGTSNVDCPYQQ